MGTYGGLWGAGYGGYLGHHLTGYGYGYAPSVYGGHHAIGKREAEAEPEADADAALYYSGLGLGYAGLGDTVLGYTGLGYTGFPYTRSVFGGYHAIGKREAEAAPDADALYYTGYTGLHGLGYYPYAARTYAGLHGYG